MKSLLTDDNVRLAYRIDGPADGPPLVFLNSIGTTLHMWEPQIAALAPTFRLIRFDTRGHGLSTVPPGPYSIERLGRDLLCLFDALELERAYICGLSLGGMVALWFSAHHPERLFGAIFANTAARIGTHEGWDTRIALVQAGGMAAVRELVLSRFFSAPFRAASPVQVASIAAMLTATDPSGYIAACAALRAADLHPLIPQIALPALIIAATLDESTPPAQSLELHQSISASTLTILDPAAHLSNLEQPTQFNAALRQFLTQV